ncbi:FmdE family protein [Candidatus Methanocrinis natronophilus]|uniref:FmdE family protein n=1 Tax=Candidatus Methanocrinis natronophilus TaxID=3033396 RepID=A0ABT5X506_9EURY|nr:FmdE family protein [Candidatus Methanocrinis natronophilus]MDF0589760.1 FmdE family protein [Candidatus Methanocrinis natronophilus]
MKIDRIIATTLLLLALAPGLAMAEGVDMYQLGSDAAEYAMAEMGFERGDADVLALTNAGYAVIDGQTTEECLDAVMEATGCTPGKGNLLNILSPPWKPLWFGFYDKNTGEAVYMKVNDDGNGFAVQEMDKIDAETVLADVEGWKPGVFDHMLPVVNVWAHEKTPYIFMKAVELHDHLCPGVSSGLLLARYMEKELPIEDATNHSYRVIACPNWCKDDYFQVAWDCTPGKGGLFVKKLTADETSALTEKFGTRVAGIFIRWDAASKTGDGLVLGFDFDKATEMSNSEGWPRWAARLQQDIILMDAVDSPETFVSTIKEFSLADEDELFALQGAGVHPLKVLGVMSG